MSTESILAFIEEHASELVALVLLVGALRIARELVPIRLPFGRLLRPAALLVAIVVALKLGLPALRSLSPPTINWRGLILAWLLAGLPVYVVWHWWRGREAREAWAKRLEQARGNERRRAPIPLQGNAGGARAAHHAAANPPQGTP